MLKQIKEMAFDMELELIKLRRKLHSNPELAFQEFKTARLIALKLKEIGLEVQEGIGRTGVVGLLKGGGPGKTIALRADMDALPIKEQNRHDYVSVNDGVMHACGHDAHTAMLFGAAAILVKLKNQIQGNIKFIFQPSEEAPPGGAIEMIKDGLLENPKVEAVFGLHVDPLHPVGIIGYKEGTMMAAVDVFQIEIIGKGGHGASPHLTVDSIVVAAEVIQALQTIVSRKTNPLEPVVLTIGTINGGYKDNIIADRVVMSGTVRTLNPGIRKVIPSLVENILKAVTTAHGANYQLDYELTYPPLVNNTDMINITREVAVEIVGSHNILPIAVPTMGGEDFSYYAERVPAAFVNLGVGFNDRENFSLHHPRFEINEQALPIGTALLASIAVRILT